MEQSREARLVKNTIIYTISNFGSKVLTFLIVPLYTYYLTTEEFGTYDTIISFMNLLTPICILAIHEGLLRWLPVMVVRKRLIIRQRNRRKA